MTSPPRHGFMVLHSNQLEGLRELMVQFLQRNPLAPLQSEVILVQSNGMKHWLEIALAQSLGVCAATQIELPSTVLWQIYRAVLGAERVNALMPLDKTPLTWRLMRRLPALLRRPEFSALARYIHAESDQPSPATSQRRIYQLAQQLADVFDGYQNYRSDWLHDWASGDFAPLAQDERWQALLWQDIQQDLLEDHTHTDLGSRSAVHQAFLQALAQCDEGQRPAGLPQRIMVFGITSLPTQTIEALAALGRVCQVMMWVQNPCQHHWGHLVESHRPLRQAARRRQQLKLGLPAPEQALSLSEQYQLHTQGNSLLAAWGKQGRDYLHLLDDFDQLERYAPFFQRVDAFIDPAQLARNQAREPSQLEQLQSDILQLHGVPQTPRPLASDDHSITLVQCHSPQREVEVLYDHLLLWLNEDATRQPNDIMVMVPDISVFAPHIHAVLGQQHSALSYHVADTTAQEEPLVQALSQLLELPQLRVTHSQWRSWFDVAALRQRFGLTSADVQTIDQWLQDAGLRWGLDAAHRQSWGIDPALTHADQNSWLFALQRLLLGYASGDQQVWQDTAATCGIGSLDAPRMSALIRWLQRIVEFQQRLRQPHTPAQWVSELQALVEAFFSADEDDAQARLIERILKPLRQWLADCDMARFDDPLPLVVVRDNWLAQIQQPAMHQRFFGAGVQFATLMPMRSIPFKLVCLLGMNEADYPRRHTPVEFDLLQRTEHWRAGDRSRRDDDRYLFLEAVLSAREKLYLSWQSKRTHDHQDLPASVLVAQLMDYLHTAWTPARVATLYPLQAFSPQYFQKNASFFTYAKQWENVRTVPTTYAAPATEHLAVPAVVSIFQLTQLLRHPTQIYTQHRLNLKLTTPKAQVLDSEPFALNPLEMYRFTLEAVLAIQQHRSQPATPKEVTQALQTQMQLRQRQGQLSLAALGHYQQNQIMEQAHALCEQLAPWLNTPYSLVNLQVLQTTLGEHTIEGQWPTPQALWLEQDHQWRQIELRPGSVSAGKADASYPRGDTLCQLWAHHLLACASGQPTQSLQIGLDSTVVFDPISPTQAQSHLQHLLDQLAVALNRPLPISCKTACVYWQQMTHLKDDAKAILAAQLQFEGSHRLRGDLEQDVHLQRYVSRFEEIASDLAMWSEQLYAPMLTHARLVQTTGISGFSLSEDHV